MAEPKHLRIDFISDVVCPWCVIGLRGLEMALDELNQGVTVDIHFQPFELNPAMPPEGQDIVEHIAEKYGSTPAQSAAARETIRARAADVGFAIASRPDGRIYNTFDAHRLLHWAGEQGRQRALKMRLFELYFSEGRSPSDHANLAEAAADAGLDRSQAEAILSSHRYAAEVGADQQYWRREGIAAVPAIIVNRQYIISGGQPPAVFAKALRSIAASG